MVREGREEFSEEAEEVRRPRGVGEGRVVPESQHEMRDNTQVGGFNGIALSLRSNYGFVDKQLARAHEKLGRPITHVHRLAPSLNKYCPDVKKNCLSQFLHKSIMGPPIQHNEKCSILSI